MLLEEWSQWSPYPEANEKKFECELLNVVVPELAELKPQLSPISVPTSPRDWFGNQATFEAWHQSSENISVPSTLTNVCPSTPSWICKSSGLDSGKESGNSQFSMSTNASFPGSLPHQTTGQEGMDTLDCRLSGDGISMFTEKYATSTDPPFTENIHQSGDYWMVDVSCESHNTCDTYEIKTRELEHITSAYKTHGQKERCHSVEGVYRQEILGEELNGEGRKLNRSRRKSYSSDIRRKVLKALSKRIGYRNFGAHISVREIFDYIIESKLVCRSCTQLHGSKFLQHQIINSNWADRLDILDQMFEKLTAICKHKFGNHVVQCFFQLSNPSVEREILLRMKKSLCDLAMSEYGSRVLQSAILSVNNEVFRIVTNVIIPNAYMLALDNFGHHVLQRIVERGSGAIVHAIMVNIIGRQRNCR